MDNRVICVVGPTATGKTKMGVALAKRFGGEVVSVDSMQIYRGMTIGTPLPRRRKQRASLTTWWQWPTRPRAGLWPDSRSRPTAASRTSSAGEGALS